MENKDVSQDIGDVSIYTGFTQIPSYDELFRLIRAAGPLNPAKARAVARALTGARVLDKKSHEQVHTLNLEEQPVPLAGRDVDSAYRSVRQQIVRVVGDLLAKAPRWVRQDLISVDPAVRLRAEDTLAAMIAASLADQIKL